MCLKRSAYLQLHFSLMCFSKLLSSNSVYIKMYILALKNLVNNERPLRRLLTMVFCVHIHCKFWTFNNQRIQIIWVLFFGQTQFHYKLTPQCLLSRPESFKTETETETESLWQVYQAISCHITLPRNILKRDRNKRSTQHTNVITHKLLGF